MQLSWTGKTISVGVLATAMSALLWLAAASGPMPISPPASGEPAPIADHGKLPLSFEPNAGRTNEQVDFISRGSGYSLYLGGNAATMQLAVGKEGSHVLRFGLAGADPAAEATGLRKLPGEVNSFIGDDSSKWRSDIPTYERVRYQDSYPGIDVDWYGREGRLEYDFRVAPGADPKQIALRLDGADSLRLAPDGDLLIEASGKTVRQGAPVAFQQINGGRRPVEAGYEIDGRRVSFRLEEYDSSRPLVIDPTLIYSTYLGGSDEDQPYQIDVDSQGFAYLAGHTLSADFPATIGADPSPTSRDGFVAKLNPTGTGLVFSTFIGGPDDDYLFGLSLDEAAGRLVLSGMAGDDFPTTASAYQGTWGGSFDAVVAELSSSGSTLHYSTYVGGAGLDNFAAAARRATDGHLIAIGSSSGSFPVTNGTGNVKAYDEIAGGGGEVTLVRLDPGTSGAGGLRYSTYLGGGAQDSGADLDLDSLGDAYITGDAGDSPGTPFPTTTGDQTHGGGALDDAFVAKVDTDVAGNTGGPTGNGGLVYSTFLGGSGAEESNGIALFSSLNPLGEVPYVSGRAGGAFIPSTTNVSGVANPPDTDAFLTLIHPNGGSVIYSTLLGGDAVDQAAGVSVDANGDAYLGGNTTSTDFPTAGDPFDPTPNGAFDAFAAKLRPAGNGQADLVASTYFGGSGTDIGLRSDFDASGNLYIAGYTNSNDLQTTSGALDRTYAGGPSNDAFIAKVAPTRTVDGSPLDLTVDETGHVQVRLDGSDRFDTFLIDTASSGLTIDLTAVSRVFGAFSTDQFVPITPPTVTGTGTPYQVTTTYGIDMAPQFALEITEVLTYFNGDTGFTATYTIENQDTDPAVYRSFVGGDLQPDGDDLGVGELDSATPRFIGGLTSPYEKGDGLLEVETWDAFQAGDASGIAGAIGTSGPPFLDNSVASSVTDIAAAVQRDDQQASGLAAGDTESFSVRWQFQRVPPALNSRKIVVRPAGGTVLVKAPGQANFRELTDERRIPIGSLIDARRGFVEVTAENTSGVDETALFWDGLFEALQSGDPFNARLAEDLACKAKKKKKKGKRKGGNKGRASASASAYASAGNSRQLWARAKGRFRTTGYKGSATIRGTEWLTEDRCAGKRQVTSFRSVEGELTIDDFTKKGTVNKVLAPGKPYVAGKPKARKKKKKK